MVAFVPSVMLRPEGNEKPVIQKLPSPCSVKTGRRTVLKAEPTSFPKPGESTVRTMASRQLGTPCKPTNENLDIRIDMSHGQGNLSATDGPFGSVGRYGVVGTARELHKLVLIKTSDGGVVEGEVSRGATSDQRSEE